MNISKTGIQAKQIRANTIVKAPMQFAKVVKYRCAQIQSLTLFNSHRTLSTASQLFRHNQPRYREAKVTVNERSKSRRDAARELLIKTNRSKWEKEIAQLELLSGRLPTSNIYLMSQFETKKHSLSEAIELLRESAHPDMYDCMDNTVSVKVKEEYYFNSVMTVCFFYSLVCKG
ncbi:unnamed protein product [Trichobilharzia regenti]|nr:unnamed protein product [Trichobilharzia regenti]